MATFFGEVQELTSRAIEIDEPSDQPTYKLSIVPTEYFSNNLQCESVTFCVGNLAEAFSKCYLTSDDSKHLFSISCKTENNENDSLLYGNIKSQTCITTATIYLVEPCIAVCEIPFNVPESVHVELLELILKHINCSSAFVLTSAPVVTYKGFVPCQETPFLMCLATSEYPSPPYSSIPHLPSPNFVSGFAAAVLTEFEIRKKPAYCALNYTESSLLDISNVEVYEKLTLFDVIKRLIKNDAKIKLAHYVQKHSVRSNLYT